MIYTSTEHVSANVTKQSGVFFRVTAYHPTENLSVIFDTNGLFEKLWQFSSSLIQKGFKIIEASTEDKIIDIDITKATLDHDKYNLRSHSKGKPINSTYEYNGITYFSIQVGNKIYIPDKNKILN